jgi:hypothetical protein
MADRVEKDVQEEQELVEKTVLITQLPGCRLTSQMNIEGLDQWISFDSTDLAFLLENGGAEVVVLSKPGPLTADDLVAAMSQSMDIVWEALLEKVFAKRAELRAQLYTEHLDMEL